MYKQGFETFELKKVYLKTHCVGGDLPLKISILTKLSNDISADFRDSDFLQG